MLAREKFDGPYVWHNRRTRPQYVQKVRQRPWTVGREARDMRERRDAQDRRENHVMHKPKDEVLNSKSMKS